MSFFSRIGNLAKGVVRTIGSNESERLSEAALEAELGKVTPGKRAERELAARKAAPRQAAPPVAEGPVAPAPEVDEHGHVKRTL